MKSSIYYLFIALLLTAAGSTVKAQTVKARLPIEPLIDSLEQVLESARGVGAMISIVTKDSILYTGGIGYANRETKTSVTDHHLFRMGSISKSFTAICLLQLLEEKGYSLDTPIKSIIPDIPIDNPWSDQHPVTSAHILEHTAGFDDLHLYAWEIKDSIQPTAKRHVELSQKSLRVRWQPGTLFSYSNAGYLVAGQLIEELSGQPYGDYIRQHFMQPIGMKSSGFYYTKPIDSPMAECYHNEAGIFTKIDFKSVNAGAAGDLISNARDMAKFLQNMLNQGVLTDSTSILTPRHYERIEIPKYSLGVKNGLYRGYGLGNGNSWNNGFEFHGHNGAIPWFSSEYIYSREANIGIAVSVNSNGFPDKIITSILNYFYPINTEGKYNKSRTIISDDVIDQYSGYYHYKNHRNQLLAFAQNMLDGRKLVIYPDSIATFNFWGSPRSTYYHDKNNVFFRKGDGINSAVLFMHNGKPVFWQQSDYALKTNKSIQIIEFLFALSALVLTILFFLYGIVQALLNIISAHRKFTPSFAWLWITSIAFILSILSFIFANLPIHELIKVILHIIYMIASIAFVILSFISVFIFYWKKPKRVTTTFYYGLSMVFMASSAVYLLLNGVIGLRLWNY